METAKFNEVIVELTFNASDNARIPLSLMLLTWMNIKHQIGEKTKSTHGHKLNWERVEFTFNASDKGNIPV